MTKYSHDVPADQRTEMVGRLARYGLSAAEIAQAVGWSRPQIEKDIQTLGGREALRPETALTYAEVFSAYVQMQHYGDSQQVWSALRGWLEIERIEAASTAAEQHLRVLMQVEADGSDASRLWHLCFSAWGWDMDDPDSRVVTDVHALVQAVGYENLPPPRSADDAVRFLIVQIAGVYRQSVAPCLSAEDRQQIMAAYETLNDRERFVLGERLGLRRRVDGQDGPAREPRILEEIGTELGLSRERIRGIEKAARYHLLDILGNCPRLLRFGALRRQAVLAEKREAELNLRLETALERVKALNAQLMSLGVEPPRPVEQEGYNEHLRKRCDEVEFSVRVQTCLRNLEIEYIHQLVRWSEPRLLKTRNFGEKSLGDIKAILHDLGLALDMKLEGFEP